MGEESQAAQVPDHVGVLITKTWIGPGLLEWMAFSIDLSFLPLPTFEFSGLSISFTLLFLLYFGFFLFPIHRGSAGTVFLSPPSIRPAL